MTSPPATKEDLETALDCTRNQFGERQVVVVQGQPIVTAE